MWVWVSVGVEMVVCEMLCSACLGIPEAHSKLTVCSQLYLPTPLPKDGTQSNY